MAGMDADDDDLPHEILFAGLRTNWFLIDSWKISPNEASDLS